MPACVPAISLTFDNGPEPGVTPHVLDVLARRAIPATFFVVGEKLARPGARALAQRAAEEGHAIGNHTLTHGTPLGELGDEAAVREEIEATQRLIGDLAHPDRLFRPFGGGGHLDERVLSPHAVEVLVAGGYTCVTWNAVPRDWERPRRWPEIAVCQCRAADPAVLVLHDLPTGAMDHLERFLDLAAQDGARFVRDFPDTCVPIRRGRIAGSLDGIVAPAPDP